VDIVQLRDKQLDDAELTTVARGAQRLCQALGALLIVNDRPTVALAAEADGVHVGQDDMHLSAVRELLGPKLLIGLSTHTPAQIDSEQAAQADYIGVGPVHATPTKPGRPAVGLQLVHHAALHARTPFFAIGGIDASNAHEALAAGATRIAVVRAIADADEPEQAARALSAALESEVAAA
jgi:thiamine-phosphate pyrophosphorylase